MSAFSEDPERSYYTFVGYFVTQYARVEWTLRGALQSMAGVSKSRYEILVGHPRSGDLIAKTRKMTARKKRTSEANAAIEDAFAHLEQITILRDRIVHFGGFALSDGRAVVHSKPRKGSRIAHDETQLGNLWNAAQDLDLISLILLCRIHPFGDKLKAMPPNAVRQAPWQYEALPQARNPKSSDTRAHPSPRRSSRVSRKK